MELCDGTLGDLIFLNPKTLDDVKMETIIAAATDICQGCAHLHQHDIVYFDLKTANVLFKRTASGMVCKVADFGVSLIISFIILFHSFIVVCQACRH
jgi:serine/threonine protein kinase